MIFPHTQRGMEIPCKGNVTIPGTYLNLFLFERYQMKLKKFQVGTYIDKKKEKKLQKEQGYLPKNTKRT